MIILHRYVWREFFSQFLICVFGFTVLGIGKIIFDYNDFFIGYHVPPSLMAQLILDQVPTLWMDVLPAASIFGAILGLGRLLRERELDVMRLAGANLLQIMAPIYLGVALICIIAYGWNDRVVPAANNRFQKEVQRLSIRQDMPLLRENVVLKGPENRFIYLQKVKHAEGAIYGVLIIETKTDGSMPRIITAASGKLKKGVWELYHGVVHDMDNQGTVLSEVAYQKLDLKMSNDIDIVLGDDKSPSAMSSGELLKLIKLDKQSGIYDPRFTVYYHLKFADPLISLVFMVLAIPLTVIAGKNSMWLGLVYCFLIIMAYYAMQVIGRTMGCNGVVSPWIAVWSPHLFFLTVGMLLSFGIEQRR